jgi:ribose 5-phosphate isomerase B
MRIALASDHHGVDLKSELVQVLIENEHEPVDVGPESDEAVDYPEYAALAARFVSDGEADAAVLICGSGVGMAITANKFPGVRAVNAHDPDEAEMARQHNDANVLALGASRIDSIDAEQILLRFLDTAFEGGRHSRRIEQIGEIERDAQAG